MKTTLSVIKAGVGSVGGHIRPSSKLLSAAEQFVRDNRDTRLVMDFAVSYTEYDIAILFSHSGGVENSDIHDLAWKAFQRGADAARDEGLYGAGQDLLADAFSGNVKGLGPAAAELEFEERKNEPFLVFAADKTDPGAYNLPLYLAFADPSTAPA